MGLIGNILRKRRLRKYASRVQTGFVPLSDIRTATFIIDAEDHSREKCLDEINSFCSAHKIKARLFHSDFRKFNRNVQPVTDAATTFTRKDIGIFGMPKMKRMRPVIAEDTDLFVSLSPDCRFTMEFLTKAMKARFKIGRCIFPGEPFDLIIRPDGESRQTETEMQGKESGQGQNEKQLEVFREISGLLEKIR